MYVSEIPLESTHIIIVTVINENYFQYVEKKVYVEEIKIVYL